MLPPLPPPNFRFATALIVSALMLQSFGCISENERDMEGQTSEVAPRVTDHNGRISLQQEQIDRLGIETKDAILVDQLNSITVFGRVIPNPNATYDLFAPYSGELVVHNRWPRLAANVTAGEQIGEIKVRVSPEILADLRSRLRESESRLPADLQAVESFAQIVQGLQAVANKQILSRTELDTAMANLARARAQVASDRAIISNLQQVIAQAQTPDADNLSHWLVPLVLSRSGQVTELMVSTSSFVEAGQQIARIVDPSKPLIRIELPQSHQADFDNSEKQLLILDGQHQIHGKYLGIAAEVSPSSQFLQYLFECDDDTGRLRPGQVIRARIEFGDKEEAARRGTAIEIPISALVYHQGLPFIFVKTRDSEFEKRAVQVLEVSEERVWIHPAKGDDIEFRLGVAEGEETVTAGAQLLLSMQYLVRSGDDD